MLNTLKSYAQNIPGWKASRKILVIQSDDWGAQRTASVAALKALKDAGVPVDRCHYTSFDSLEGNDDLCALFEVLGSFRDHRDMPVRFTANCLMANPDYGRVAQQAYETFFWEPVQETVKRSKRTDQVISLWKTGYSEGFFVPQLHGREHLHTERWLESLRCGEPLVRLCFEHEMYGLSGFFFEPKRKSYLAALDYETPAHRELIARALHDALENFREIFGFESKSFIAPNYVWDDSVEATLSKRGVRYLQSARVQRISEFSAQAKRHRRRWQGQRNRNNQFYQVRNVQFEPASNPSKDWVGEALKEMAIAFQVRSPAVLSTHRVNFVGHLSEKNRAQNLESLTALLKQALKNWPDLEFWTTEELGDAMAQRGVA